ncbi:MAG TPA: acetyl-CoA hydrolase/transferase C-terminal domain-containing protein, partial [Nevskiaceae bacterium]|nr:acetyl-CoA hydrolase/transferase C-terminal domain-containing protein [Nevskiaceae bacterium]
MPAEVSLDALASRLSPGERVFVPGCTGEPQAFTQRLVDDPALAPGVQFVTSFVPGINGRHLAGPGSTRRMQVFFMQPAYEAARAEGRVDFTPLNYHGAQQHLLAPATAPDALLIEVGEPDAEGRCPAGGYAEFLPAMLERATRVLAVVNPNVPRVPRGAFVAFDRLEAFARSTSPLAAYDAGGSNPVTDRIVAHLAALIPNGATIQVGLGKVPAQLIPALKDHRDIGFHSGMLSDALLDLPGAPFLRKGADIVTGVVVGTQRLYDGLAGIAGLRLEGFHYTHDPAVLARVPRLHAINSALEVDLLGQVNAEALNGRSVSGPGGLPDFAAAAHRSAEGLSIIALPATDPK